MKKYRGVRCDGQTSVSYGWFPLSPPQVSLEDVGLEGVEGEGGGGSVAEVTVIQARHRP